MLSSNTKMCEGIENLSIERMTSSDLEQVVEIENQSFSDPWTKDNFVSESNNQVTLFLVAKSNQRVIGYACVWIIIDEVHIGNLAVASEYRKKGIGEKLLKEVFKQAEEKNAKFATLEVRASNSAAINLYKKYGFVEERKRKNYYRNPIEDALVMIKNF